MRTLIVIFLAATTVYAQNTVHHFVGTNGIPASSVATVVQKAPPTLRAEVALDDNRSATLDFRRVNAATPFAQLMVQSNNGLQCKPLSNVVVSYTARTSANEDVILTMSTDGTVLTSVVDPDGDVRGTHAFTEGRSYAVGAPAPVHAPFTCGTNPRVEERVQQRLLGVLQEARKTREHAQTSDTITLRIAVEADYELYSQFKTEAAVTTYVTQLISSISAVYLRDLKVRLVLSNIRVWKTEADPYDADKGIFSLLYDFVDLYRNTMTAVERDIAVFLTSGGATGGIARTIGGLCEEDGSYCAGDVSGTFAVPGEWAWDVGMLAHELGHVCGGIHTQSCYWPTGPLDSCVSGESGACLSDNETRPTRGTIMSYCHQQIPNGGTMAMVFHPLHKTVLRSFIEKATCGGGVTVPRTSVLRGTAVDGVTGAPLAGIALRLRPLINDIYRATELPAGDTITTALPDGSFAFTGLAHGLYTVVADGSWIAYPPDADEYSAGNSVMMATDSVHFVARFTSGRRGTVMIANNKDTTPVTLTIYSTVIPNAYLTATLTPANQVEDSLQRSAMFPIGRYIVVPSAVGRTFQPPFAEVDVSLGQGDVVVRFGSTSTLPELRTTLSVAHIERMGTEANRTYAFVSGRPYEITDINTGEAVASGTMPANGVIVLRNFDASAAYTLNVNVDTASKSPISSTAWLYPAYGLFGSLVEQVNRRFPLVARSYGFRVSNAPYQRLSNPTMLRGKGQTSQSHHKVELPFDVRVKDRTMSRMYVSKNGFVTFSNNSFPTWSSSPVAQNDEAEFVVSVFGSELFPDPETTSNWHIAYELRGAEPNRSVVIEWLDMKSRFYDWENGRAEDIGRFGFQLHIHERGKIEMCYKRPADIPKPVSAQVGLRGSDILDNQLLALYSENSFTSARAVFTPNASTFVTITSADAIPDGVAFVWEDPTTSVSDENNAQQIRLSPIPSETWFAVHGLESPGRLTVVDMQGKTVLVASDVAGPTAVSVASLAPGHYTVVVDTPGKRCALPLVIHR